MLKKAILILAILALTLGENFPPSIQETPILIEDDIEPEHYKMHPLYYDAVYHSFLKKTEEGKTYIKMVRTNQYGELGRIEVFLSHESVNIGLKGYDICHGTNYHELSVVYTKQQANGKQAVYVATYDLFTKRYTRPERKLYEVLMEVDGEDGEEHIIEVEETAKYDQINPKCAYIKRTKTLVVTFQSQKDDGHQAIYTQSFSLRKEGKYEPFYEDIQVIHPSANQNQVQQLLRPMQDGTVISLYTVQNDQQFVMQEFSKFGEITQKVHFSELNHGSELMEFELKTNHETFDRFTISYLNQNDNEVYMRTFDKNLTEIADFAFFSAVEKTKTYQIQSVSIARLFEKRYISTVNTIFAQEGQPEHQNLVNTLDLNDIVNSTIQMTDKDPSRELLKVSQAKILVSDQQSGIFYLVQDMVYRHGNKYAVEMLSYQIFDAKCFAFDSYADICNKCIKGYQLDYDIPDYPNPRGYCLKEETLAEYGYQGGLLCGKDCNICDLNSYCVRCADEDYIYRKEGICHRCYFLDDACLEECPSEYEANVTNHRCELIDASWYTGMIVGLSIAVVLVVALLVFGIRKYIILYKMRHQQVDEADQQPVEQNSMQGSQQQYKKEQEGAVEIQFQQ